MKKITLFIILVIQLTIQHVFAASASDCSSEKTTKMSEDVGNSSIPDWESLYASFLLHGSCDMKKGFTDVELATKYDEIVTELLTNNWVSIKKLNQLTRKNKKFERFVLRHIDEMMSQEELQQIAENAQKSCPRDSKNLCLKIKNTAKSVQNKE